MNRIGFDLGVTTSCVSFFNQEKNAFDYLRFGGGQLDFFPTRITYRPGSQPDSAPSILVGTEALRRMRIKGAKSYDGKMKLKLEGAGRNSVKWVRCTCEAIHIF